MSPGRILALDVGDVRIGVAVSDETNTISTGIDVIKRKYVSKDIEKIKDYIKEYNVSKVVVGLPLTLRGTKSAQTLKVEDFISDLKKNLNVEITTFDESLTTAEGEEILIAANMSRKKRKAVIDKVAAQIILQEYLELNRAQNN